MDLGGSDSTTGMVVEVGRRSGRVVNGLDWACACGLVSAWLPCIDRRKFWTAAAASLDGIAALSSTR